MDLQIIEQGDYKRILDKENQDIRKIIKYVLGFIAILSLFALNPIIDILTYGGSIFYDDFYHTMFFTSFMLYFSIIGMYLFVNYKFEPLILSINSITRELTIKDMRLIIEKNATLQIEEYNPKSSDRSHGWRVYLFQSDKKFQLLNKTGTKSDRKDIVNLFQKLSDELRIEVEIMKGTNESISISWENSKSNTNNPLNEKKKLGRVYESGYINSGENDFNFSVNSNSTKLKINNEPVPKKFVIYLIFLSYFMVTSYVAMLIPGWLSAYGIKNNYDIVIVIEIILFPITSILTYIIFNFFNTTYNEVEIKDNKIIFRKDGGLNRKQVFLFNDIKNITPIYKSKGISVNLQLVDNEESVNLPIKQKYWDLYDSIENEIFNQL